MREFLESFLLDRQFRGVSPRTVEWYRVYLSPWLEKMGGEGQRTRLISHLHDHYRNDRSRAAAWRAIRAFTRWLAGEGLERDWTGEVHMRFAPAPPVMVLAPAEFQAIMDRLPRTWTGNRDRTLYGLLWATGARRDAIRGLRRADVLLADQALRVRTKGAREQLLYLPRSAALDLNSWLLHLGPDHDWVFPSGRGADHPVSGHWVSHQLPRYAALAGIRKRVYTHLLRHSFVTRSLAAGVPIQVVRQAAGHASIETTMLYEHGSFATMRAAFERGMSSTELNPNK